MKPLRTLILAAAVCAAIGAPMTARAQGTIEQIAAQLLGGRFGVPAQQIFDLSRRSQQDVFELAPTYALSRQTRHPANEVWRLREQGLGWGEIAHRLGMNPGTFNKMRVAGAFDRDTIWSSIYRTRYGVSSADLNAIRRRGGSQRDMLPAVIIARSSRVSPISAYDRYRKYGDWDRTAETYKVDFKKHGKPDSSIRRPTSSNQGRRPAHSMGKAGGPGKGDKGGSGQGTGNAGGQGRGHGQGKGQDKGGPGGGKGQGHGNGHGKGGG